MEKTSNGVDQWRIYYDRRLQLVEVMAKAARKHGLRSLAIGDVSVEIGEQWENGGQLKKPPRVKTEAELAQDADAKKKHRSKMLFWSSR